MHGQRVLVVARWILVVSGLLLALLNPMVLGELKIQVGLILVARRRELLPARSIGEETAFSALGGVPGERG